ncbi:hypothetical protein D0Z07_8518 [Hyphodiscus hymeniophilus]|uniref:Uncharacterized protein n=1 Tax=Hyphodiscus hymeniophilus TaxID=353542 RepID=A0A9P6SK95_9HELO|nr:hypothetical protein D0Z07_8518 [Hyphodiscus hymeniophilus]
MSATETLQLAHTVRCKLQLAADRPDRNLRFILGHAFTLDKLRLRIAEIEMDKADEEDMQEELSEPLGAPPHRERRVSFRNNLCRPTGANRPRSPPPDEYPDMGSDSDSPEEDDIEEDDEEDEGLGLQRFESGSARRPQMVDDDGEDEDEEEIKTPPPIPSEEELRMITGGEDDEELREAYTGVAACPCHGKHKESPKTQKIWDIPQKPGETGPRYAVVSVEA